MAKKRVYEIAKEKGLTSQEVLERLQAGGLEIKSSASSIEEADAERLLKAGAKGAKPKASAEKTAQKKPAEKAKAATKKTATPGTSAKTKSTEKPKPPAKAKTTTAGAEKPKSATKTKTAAEAAEKTKAEAKPKAGEKKTVEPKDGAKAGKVEKPKTTATKTAGKADKAKVSAPKAAPKVESDQTAAQGEVPAEKPKAAKPVAKPAGPRGRGRRLDNMPTVVGPGVPLRKGVKPPGHVLTKEELERQQAKKAAEAAAKPRSAPSGASGGPGKTSGARGPQGARVGQGRPPVAAAGPAGRPPQTGQRGRKGGQPRESAERRDRPTREASAPIPGIWAEAAEATGLVGPSRASGPSRVRRGDDRSTKRRVIIDSQAGRKGGKGGVKDRKGPGAGEAEAAPKKKAPPGTESPVRIMSGASAKDLSEALELGAGELIKTLMGLGEMVTITQSLSDEAITVLAEEFERQVEIEHAEEEIESAEAFVDDPADLSPRAPVVTIMGHVDHGKTSLLDAIRETEVVKGEAGGITQHIGAYQVTHEDKKVTFLDTPGHEAFTAMRARGAKSTDIAVIVVAANDGVMPQTLEAISHAKAAEVPIIVAINKMDVADANPDMVKKQLSDEGLVPEGWGGDTITVEVSAKQRTNLAELMDMILLVAEVQELKANAGTSASGVVIEAQLDVGRGPVATILVQRGTLAIGDSLACGEAYGKVKAMFDFTGSAISGAGPSVPAQILGFNTPPAAGDSVMVVKDEREARQKAEQRTARLRQEQLARGREGATSLEEFHRRVKEGQVKELRVVIKGDVGGSVEALGEALQGITHEEVKVVVVFAGVGGINESDVMLAAASGAVVIGFNVRPSAAAKTLAEQEQVDVRTYRVIYKAIEDVEAALVGMLEPEQVEEELGTAEVRKVFHASRVGTIAGCYVQDGKITRSAKIRLVRDGSIVHEGEIASLKRFNDDAREVAAGYECGLHLEGFDDIHEGDVVEAYEIKEVARTQ